MQVSPATRYDTISAGPATSFAAAPVATKIPAPITAPIPSAVRFTGPSARFRRFSPSISARIVSSGLRASSWRLQDIEASGGGTRTVCEKTVEKASLSIFVALAASSGKRCRELLARKVLLNHLEKFFPRRYLRYVRPEEPRAV